MRTAQEALNPLSPQFLASAARTTSGNSETFDAAEKRELIVTVNVTAASGSSPTLAVQAQHSPDGVIWDNLGTAFTTVTAAPATLTKTFGTAANPFHRYVRASYTIGGTTPSFTFSVLGTAK